MNAITRRPRNPVADVLNWLQTEPTFPAGDGTHALHPPRLVRAHPAPAAGNQGRRHQGELSRRCAS